MQKRNYYNSILDFILDSSFQKWVRQNEDTMNWEEWTLENTERAILVEEARQWILAMKVEESKITKLETQQALISTWGKIKEPALLNKLIRFDQVLFFRSIAAMLAVGIIIFLFIVKFQDLNFSQSDIASEPNSNSTGLIEQFNNTDKPQLITLSDASSILLQPKSKLSYPKIFIGNFRKVYLSGEAFFEITKDPQKPFLVYANETITKVFGTSFRVIAFSDQSNVEILVRTGKVKVSAISKGSNSSSNEVTLYPNQAARFERKSQIFEKIIDITHHDSFVESSNAIEQLSFEFRDVPVSQIFATLEQAYLINIDFPSDKLKDCYLTSSLIDDPLPEKLKIICESIGNNTRFEMNGNQVKIISNGCN